MGGPSGAGLRAACRKASPSTRGAAGRSVLLGRRSGGPVCARWWGLLVCLTIYLFTYWGCLNAALGAVPLIPLWLARICCGCDWLLCNAVSLFGAGSGSER